MLITFGDFGIGFEDIGLAQFGVAEGFVGEVDVFDFALGHFADFDTEFGNAVWVVFFHAGHKAGAKLIFVRVDIQSQNIEEVFAARAIEESAAVAAVESFAQASASQAYFAGCRWSPAEVQGGGSVWLVCAIASFGVVMVRVRL